MPIKRKLSLGIKSCFEAVCYNVGPRFTQSVNGLLPKITIRISLPFTNSHFVPTYEKALHLKSGDEFNGVSNDVDF